MANRILVYQDGQRLGIEGTSTGQVLSWNNSTGAWELSVPAGGGTVTSVTAGTGLSGGTITTTGTISADFGTGAGKIAQGNDSRFPPAPAAAGRVLYDTGSAWVALAAGTTGKVLTSNGAAAPSWETPAAGGVTSITAGTGLTGGTITTTGTISADFGTTTGKIAQGDDSRFNPAPSAAGKLPYDTGTGYTALTLGAAGTFLKAGASAPSWASITASDVSGVATSGANSNITSLSGLTTALSVGQGGTGQQTLAQYAVLLGAATSGVATAAPGDAGKVLTSNGAAANPTFQSMPYDVSGEAGGTPDVSTVIWHFKAVRPFTLKGTGSVADCETAPSGNVSFTIKKIISGVTTTIGTIDYTSAGTSGTVTITGSTDHAIGVGDKLTLTTPGDLKTMEAPFWTFFATCP